MGALHMEYLAMLAIVIILATGYIIAIKKK